MADVFENFRKTCIEDYKLDPSNSISAPSLAWDAMLFMTGIELDLITNLEMLEMIEKMKRGGLCCVGSERHVKANNHYMIIPTKPETCLMYFDANNLYGWAMMQLLAYNNLKFNTQIKLEDILKTEDDNQIGYYVECDLEYPEELHDTFKEFPPCPETIIPKEEWLSDFQLDIIKQNNMKHSKCPKLVPHLMKHEKYVIHYRNLKYINKRGVKITEVHRVIEFEQKAWMKPYIETTTKYRSRAKNEFEKDFFKLMNNSVFAKTMENVKIERNYI